MRIAALALALLPAAAMAGERAPLPAPHFKLPAKAKAACQIPGTDYAVARLDQPVRAGTLAQEPLANLYLSVQRVEDGCDLPVKIADGVGDKQR